MSISCKKTLKSKKNTRLSSILIKKVYICIRKFHILSCLAV